MDDHDSMHYEGLEGEHRYELRVDSLISPERIRDRYYQTVKADDLPDLFADYQHREGLLIPI